MYMCCSLRIFMTWFLSIPLDEGPVCVMTSTATSLTLSSLGSLGQLAFSCEEKRGRGGVMTIKNSSYWSVTPVRGLFELGISYPLKVMYIYIYIYTRAHIVATVSLSNIYPITPVPPSLHQNVC